jgi:hypothetical protein
MKWIVLCSVILVGCSTCTPVQVYSAKEKRCLRDMESVMRHVDPFFYHGEIPLEIAKEWTNVKYECWKEGI